MTERIHISSDEVIPGSMYELSRRIRDLEADVERLKAMLDERCPKCGWQMPHLKIWGGGRESGEGDGHGGTGANRGAAPDVEPSPTGRKGTKPRTVLDRGARPMATEGDSGSSPEPAPNAAANPSARKEARR